MTEERHLMPAEMTDPDLIRVVLSGMPMAKAIATPPGIVAITRRAVLEAGLDTLAVTRWLQPLGGFGAVAYLHPASHRLPPHPPPPAPPPGPAREPYRAALHPVSYFAVPVTALQGAAEPAEDAPADSAVA